MTAYCMLHAACCKTRAQLRHGVASMYARKFCRIACNIILFVTWSVLLFLKQFVNIQAERGKEQTCHLCCVMCDDDVKTLGTVWSNHALCSNDR